MAEVVVTAYGAVGDGRTPNEAAIVRAISDAATTGKVLRFPSGIYRITGRVVVTGLKDIRIVGDPGAVIQAPPNVSPDFHMLTFRNCNGVILEGLTIDGNQSNINVYNNGGHGLVLSYGTTNVTVRDCTFKNIADTCISDPTQGAFTADYNPPVGDVKESYHFIVNNRFINADGGYNNKGSGSRFVVISQNHFIGINVAVKIDGEIEGGIAPYPKSVAGFIISNNVIYNSGRGTSNAAGSGGYAFVVEEGAENVTITDNEVYGTFGIGGFRLTDGQKNRPCKNIRLLNNRFYDIQNSYAIDITGGVGFENIVIEGNEFLRSTRGMVNILCNASGIIKGLSIKNNKFADWGTGNYAGDTGFSNTPGMLLNLGGINERIEITGNEFLRTLSSYSTGSRTYMLKIEVTTIRSRSDLIIEDNTFYNLNPSEIVVGFTGTASAPNKGVFRRNKVIKGVVSATAVDLDFTGNWVEGTVRFAGLTGGTKSSVDFHENTLYRGTDSYLVYVQMTNINARNNRFDPAVSAPKSVTSDGSYRVMPPET